MLVRNHCFYWNGCQNRRLFEEDGIHINVDGTREIFLQTKKAPCIHLDIENDVKDFGSRKMVNLIVVIMIFSSLLIFIKFEIFKFCYLTNE